MSLLMDALKKAELAKRQGQGEAAASPAMAAGQGSGLSLEPIPGSGPAEAETKTGNAEILPKLPSHLEELDAQFLAEATQAAAARLKAQTGQASALAGAARTPPLTDSLPRPVPANELQRPPPDNAAPQARSAAQNLFAAKQAERPAPRKAFAIAMGVLTVLSISGIGGYFWWQLQPKSAQVANRAPLQATGVVASAPAAVPPAPTYSAPPVAPVAAIPGTTRSAPDHDKDDASRGAAKEPAQARREVAAPVGPDGPIRLTKAPLKVNPALIRGFDAFNQGDLALAQIEYERAQKTDPRNSDAMHGLAAIAVRQGRLDQAEWLYRQIADADPQDTVAIAALINMRGQVDPGTAESRLKSLAAAQPDLAAPYFSLGNLYARHERWNDAQQAYFRAYSAEPDNPDILYNLAISLEHLHQNKLAAQYYSQAIAAAQTKPAGFDKAAAAARLRSLQP